MFRLTVFWKSVLLSGVLLMILTACVEEVVEITPPKPVAQEESAMAVSQATEPPVADSVAPEESTAVADAASVPATTTPVLTAEATTTPSLNPIIFQDISFDLADIAKETIVENIPALEQGADLPYFAIKPAFQRIDFVDYPLPRNIS